MLEARKLRARETEGLVGGGACLGRRERMRTPESPGPFSMGVCSSEWIGGAPSLWKGL